MPLVKGAVQQISNFATKKPGVYMYSIIVDGSKYGTGPKKPACKEGDFVQFEASQNARGYTDADLSTLVVLKEAGPTEVSKSVSEGAVTSNSYVNRAEQDARKQEAISKQAARNTAVAFMTLLRDQEALPMAASAKTPKAKFEILNTVLDELTDKFYRYSAGLDASDSPAGGPDGKSDPAMEAAASDRPWED